MHSETHHYTLPTNDKVRPYVCSDCDTIVAPRWSPGGGFNVGCDCTTIPIVPQVGQGDPPDEWRVLREPCCRDADVSTLDTVYGDDFADYQCPDCHATFSWNGQMVSPPDERDNSHYSLQK